MGGNENELKKIIVDIQEKLPSIFNMVEIKLRAQPLLEEDEGPYVLVALQETTRMNVLLSFMEKTLEDLTKGLNGELNMTTAMDELSSALIINQVPGRNIFHSLSWEEFAWPSKRPLASWYTDMLRRVEQLTSWAESLNRPLSMWLPGLFNPMAFLTALMQV